jgi:hypothetical protein
LDRERRVVKQRLPVRRDGGDLVCAQVRREQRRVDGRGVRERDVAADLGKIPQRDGPSHARREDLPSKRLVERDRPVVYEFGGHRLPTAPHAHDRDVDAVGARAAHRAYDEPVGIVRVGHRRSDNIGHKVHGSKPVRPMYTGLVGSSRASGHPARDLRSV